MEIRNFSQSEWNNDIFHDFSGIWRGEALRELIGNMTSANLNDIFLFKEQNERCEEIADDESVQTENTKLSYFVARRCLNELWQFVRSVGETELGAAIHRRVDNGAEVVIVRCVDFPTLTSRLSVLGSWRNYRFVVPVTHIWLCNDGDFCIELGAETDLRHFLKESAKDFCVRHIVYKMVELHKYSWETKLLWYPSNFVIDIDGNLNMIPRGRLCRKDVCDRESVHVFICGKNLFSITSVPGLCGKDEEKIIQSCMDPEKDRPTFSSLLTNLSSMSGVPNKTKGLRQSYYKSHVEGEVVSDQTNNIPPEIQKFIDLSTRSNPQERPTATQLLTDSFLTTGPIFWIISSSDCFHVTHLYPLLDL